jgi:uncharacterized protein
MICQEALAVLKEHLPELRSRYGVKRLALFGSVARDEAREDGGVDVLVEFAEPATLFELVGLKEELEALLGCNVRLTLARREPSKRRSRSRCARISSMSPRAGQMRGRDIRRPAA